MKYRIYIDEVGYNDMRSSTDPNHRFLCLTGVVFDIDYIKATVNPDVESLKTKYFNSHPDEPVIFHRKELVNKKYPFNSLHNEKTEQAFNINFLALLEKWNFQTISVLIDKLEHKNRYETWRFDPYHYGMSIMFERYFLLLNQIDQVGDMMFESRGGKEDLNLKASYRKIFEEGTEWIRSQDIK